MDSLVRCQVWLPAGSSLGMLVILRSLVDSDLLSKSLNKASFLQPHA